MNGSLKATAQLSLASLLAVATGLISAKVLAVVLGPTGMGYLGLLQSTMGLATVIGGLGLSTVLVRQGSKVDANGPLPADWERAALGLALVWNAILLGVWVLTAPQLLTRFHVSHVDGVTAVALGLTIVVQSLASLQVAGLKLRRQVGAIARASAFTAVLAPLLTVILVGSGGRAAVAPALLASSIVSWLAPWYLLRRFRSPAAPAKARRALVSLGLKRGLLVGGIPLMLSALVGAATRTAVPLMVLARLGERGVGFYVIGTTLSGTYLGFLANTMAQDYFPRQSAVRGQRHVIARAINVQQQLILTIAVPMIATVELVGPWLVPLVWSRQFLPALPMIRWMVFADLLRFSSWSLSFVILSEYGGTVYLLTEITGGVATVVLSFLGLKWWGITGIGIAVAAKYAFYFGLVWFICRRRLGFTWQRGNFWTLLGAEGLLLGMVLLPIQRSAWMTWLEAPLDGALVLIALTQLWRQVHVKKLIGRLRERKMVRPN